MAEAFDPYHIWLGIPPEDQPPHHYRLLGVKAFETNADALESAADQRMVHVRSFQGGKHSAESQKLLNELAAARLCLLSPEKRQAYDRELKAKLAAEKPPKAPPRPAATRPLAMARPLSPQPSGPAVEPAVSLGFDPLAQTSTRRSPKQRRSNTSPAIYAGVGLGLVAVVAVAWIAIGSGGDESRLVATRPAGVPPADPTADADHEPDLAPSRPAGWPAKTENKPVLDPNVAQPETDKSSEPRELAEEDEGEMTVPPADATDDMAADDRPETPGHDQSGQDRSDSQGRTVTADTLVLWNSHNNDWNDRGMRSCNVELRQVGQVVWSQKGVPLDWKNDEDPATTIALPKIPFDALRVETVSFQGLGSSLSEIEVFRGKTNLARAGR